MRKLYLKETKRKTVDDEELISLVTYESKPKKIHSIIWLRQ